MRRLLLFILICWPLLFSGTICNVVVGQGSAAAGVADDTVLFGDQNEYSTSSQSLSAHDKWYYQDRSFTASWAASDATTTAGHIWVRIAGHGGGSFAAAIFNGDGTPITNGCGTYAGTLSYEAGYTWRCIDLASPITITKGNTYRIAICPSSGDAVRVPVDATAAMFAITATSTGSYECNPPTLSNTTAIAGYLGGIYVTK